jgi:hypothetical protein
LEEEEGRGAVTIPHAMTIAVVAEEQRRSDPWWTKRCINRSIYNQKKMKINRCDNLSSPINNIYIYMYK